MRSPAVRSRLQTVLTILSMALTAIMVLGVMLSLSLPAELPYAH